MTQPATVVIKVNDVQALRALDNFARKMNDIGRRMQAVGKTLSLAGGAASAPFGLSAKTFADTDDALRAVGVISGSTEKEMAKLRETAKSFNTFAPRDVAAEMLKLAQAGLTASDSMKAVASSLALQRIDPEIGNQASEIVTKIAVPFGKVASDFDHIADILAIASSRSTTSVGNLGIAMGYAANQGELAGLSIEQAAAAMAILADNGIDASRAGTNLRGILSTLVAKQKKFEKLGVKILDDEGEVRKIEDIFRDLNKSLSGLGDGERLAVLIDTFGKLYSGGAAGLLKDAERFDSLVKEMESSEGAALRWAEAMDAGAGGALRSLKKDVLSISESIGAPLQGPLIAASVKFRELGKSLIPLIEGNPRVVQGFAAVAGSLAVLGPSLVVAGYSTQIFSAALASAAANGAKLLTVLSLLRVANLGIAATASVAAVAYTSLAAAQIAASVGPVALIAIGVAAGVALVALEAFASFRFGTDFIKQSGTMQIILQGLRKGFNALRGVFGAVSSAAQMAFAKMAGAVRTVGSVLSIALDPRKILRAVAALAKQIVEPFRNAFRTLAAVLGPVALRAFDQVSLAVGSAFTVIVNAAEFGLARVAEFFAPLVQAARDAAQLVFGPFVAAFRILFREAFAVTSGTIRFFGGLAVEMGRIAGQLGAAFADTFRDIAPSISLITDALRQGDFQQAFEFAAQAAKYAFQRAFIEIQIAWSQFVGYFAKAFDGAIQAAIDRMRQAVIDLSKAFEPIVRTFTLIKTGGDQVAASNAVDSLKSETNELLKSLRGVQDEIDRATGKAGAAAKREIIDLKKQSQELEAAFNRERGGVLLQGFISDVTKGASGFGKAMQEALTPLGGILEGFGYDLGGKIADAAAEAESLFTSQVFGGAAKQVIALNKDAIGDQQLDIAKKQLETLKGIEEGVDELEFAWG